MRHFSYLISFLSHPIWFPIYGAMLVLFNIPFFLPIEEVRWAWLMLLIFTVALPTLIYLTLFVLNWIKDPFVVPIEKQKWLLYGYIAILLGVAFKITPMENFPILYFYLLNLIISCFLLLFLQFLGWSTNWYTMGMGALTIFAILLSISFEKDMTCLLAFFIFLSGASFTAQTYLTQQELWLLLLSWGIGALPQLSLLVLFKNLLFGLQ